MRISFLFLTILIFQIVLAVNVVLANETDNMQSSVLILPVFDYADRPLILPVGGGITLDSDKEENEEEDFVMRAENLYSLPETEKFHLSAPVPYSELFESHLADKEQASQQIASSSTPTKAPRISWDAQDEQNSPEDLQELHQVVPNDDFLINSVYGSEIYLFDDFQDGYHVSDESVVFPHQSPGPYFIKGWISAGASISGRKPINSVDSARMFPDTYNKFLLNQLYLTMGRNVNKNRRCFDIGGRVDLLYGSDYYFTSSLGLETRKYAPDGGRVWNLDPKSAAAHWNSSDGDRNHGHAARYGLSMPQLYGEIFAPFGRGTTVRFGHFYSPMGFESAMSTENFFYSHTFSMSHGEPVTLTGVVVNQQITERLIGYAGYTNGWNVWESPRGKVSVLAGAKWESCSGNTGLAFSIHSGNAHDIGEYGSGDRTNYSLVLSQRLTPRLMWAIQHDLGKEDNVNVIIAADGTREYIDGKWASIINYLFYDIYDTLSAGARFEWFRDHNNSRIVSFFPYESVGFATTGKNYYNMTLGLNWRPTSYFTFRPEIRWDWSDVKRHTPNGEHRVFSDFRSKNMFTASLEGVIRF